MKEIVSVNEMQQIIFDILCYFKGICDENGLTYYLTYGTLLGAVRHSGFIPWDDDADVFMPRDDFNRLIEILEKNPHRYYRLLCHETDDRFRVPLPKIIDTRTVLNQKYGLIERVSLGVYLDVYVLDGIGNDRDKAFACYEKGELLLDSWVRANTMLFPPYSKNRVEDVFNFFGNLPCKIKGIDCYLRKINELALQNSFAQSKYVATFSFVDYRGAAGNVFEKSYFGKGMELSFEKVKFRIPEKYEKALDVMFDNYRQLPPESQRVSAHKYEAYWK